MLIITLLLISFVLVVPNMAGMVLLATCAHIDVLRKVAVWLIGIPLAWYLTMMFFELMQYTLMVVES